MEECYTLGLRLRGLVACFMMYVRTCERLDGCVALVISVPFVYIMHLARAGVLYIVHIAPSIPWTIFYSSTSRIVKQELNVMICEAGRPNSELLCLI